MTAKTATLPTKDEFLQYVIDRINKGSHVYTAAKSCKPKRYLTDSNLNRYSMEYILRLERKITWKNYQLPKQGMVFSPDLYKQVVKWAAADRDFRQKLITLQLTDDDIEHLVYKLTYGFINLRMLGSFYDV